MPKFSPLSSSWLAVAVALFTLSHVAQAIPYPIELDVRASVSPVSAAQVSSYKPFTYYASAAYCKPATTKDWSCGQDCEANSQFQPIETGGDGAREQFWYVGIDPKLQSVIVAHQGTDPSKFRAVLTDLKIAQTNLDSKIFPGISSNIKVHTGFASAHALSFNKVLAAVKKALAQSKFKQVAIVGHSLGGALALLDGVALPLHIPGVQFRTVTYGQPRVGNDAFALYVNTKIRLDRITNKDDVVAIIPGRKMGFQHASGEMHITKDGSWVTCVGIDNTDPRCSVGDVSTVFQGSISDHSGPYDGVMIGCRGGGSGARSAAKSRAPGAPGLKSVVAAKAAGKKLAAKTRQASQAAAARGAKAAAPKGAPPKPRAPPARKPTGGRR